MHILDFCPDRLVAKEIPMRGKQLNVLFIQPTLMRLDGSPVKARKRLIMTMVTSYLAGLTPSSDNVTVIDDKVEEIPWNGDFDLVAITTTTGSAQRAYQIAGRFRERKIPVVMGGFHATLHPAEILTHADSVVVGEAENVWGNFWMMSGTESSARSTRPNSPAT